MALSFDDVAYGIALALIAKSGVREWESSATRAAITDAAVEMALAILYEEVPGVAVTAVFREQDGTAKVFKSSGGDAALTLVSLANAAYRESVKVDLGATRAQLYAVYLDVELAATPTAGNTIDLWANPSSSATAGTDNRGGCAGVDQAYTGYSSNAAASVKQLPFIGSAVCTTQATATVQKMFIGYYSPPERYLSVVLLNGSGAAVHTSDTNCKLTFTPVEFTSEPS